MSSNREYKANHYSIGQIFTPPYVSEFMVKNLLTLYRREKNLTSEPDFSNLRVLEPSVGEGIFLKHLNDYNFREIMAYELDATLKDELTDKYPEVTFKFENFLGASTEKKYDLIVGNPPYLGQNYNAELFRRYKKKYSLCERYFSGNMDIFYYFIHQAIEKLKPRGLFSFITTNYWITKSKKTGIKHLKPHILETCYLLQYLDLSKLNVFPKAQGQHNCIFVFRKKTAKEIQEDADKPIDIISIKNKDIPSEQIFHHLIENKSHASIIKYRSATTNEDLKPTKSWNLLYPEEIKRLVLKIEEQFQFDNEVKFLNDFFIIRNGLIFISDNLFILDQDKDYQIKNDEFYLKIKETYEKLKKNERKKLKRLFKSKNIIPYGYKCPQNEKYAIYFNKKEFNNIEDENIGNAIQKEYPTLYKYITQYKGLLKKTLVNAKENPHNLFFPRRGAFIRLKNEESKPNLLDLEPYYDNQEKIFFKYILDTNEFGFSSDQYYATSDTYFLWKKDPSVEIDYFLLLAYLNSKIVEFLFKAKNIKIKRSKTKLESNIPLPSFILKNECKNLENKNTLQIIQVIERLSELTINLQKSNRQKTNFVDFKQKLDSVTDKLQDFPFLNKVQILKNISTERPINSIKKLIDSLFFTLFQLDREKTEHLMQKYYLE